MPTVVDQYGRTFKTLRISLTPICNLACTYCTAQNGKAERLQKTDEQELVLIIKELHNILGLQTIRFTGGEPLLYPQLEQLISQIASLGIGSLKLTTNGTLLAQKAKALKAAGIRSINVSLDALEEKTYKLMSRRSNLQSILDGIDTALAEGIQLKINSVIMKGQNEEEILPLFDFAKKRQIPIRFLELMQMGYLYQKHEDFFFSQKEILKTISQKYDFQQVIREKSATANYWQTTDGYRFGIIANNSAPFCSDCNRLRLDTNGKIYGCLSSNQPIDLKEVIHDKVAFIEALQTALSHKKMAFTGSSLSMMAIGG